MVTIKVKCFTLFLFVFIKTFSQTTDCEFKLAVINIDFGTVANLKNIDLSLPKNYSKSKVVCPDDGQYAITHFSPPCFDYKWHALLQDHTANDVDGKMMVVNASINPSTFFKHNIIGLTPGRTYQVSFYLVNICKSADGCVPTPPNIQFILLNKNAALVKVQTGTIVQTKTPEWRWFYTDFVMPSVETVITLQMEDITVGGCGNDFAIDDIAFRECKKEEKKITAPILVKELSKPSIVLEKPKQKSLSPIIAKVVEKSNVIPKPIVEKKLPVISSNKQIKEGIIQPKEKTIIIPKLLQTRDNEVVRKIETEEAEMIIELYDNGEIDGDTVTIFHNNIIVANHAGLSTKPITLTIKVNKNQPHHELVMVADNLGSIPPNTSLMIINANKKRYEVYISSSDKKNAKVIIDLKEK